MAQASNASVPDQVLMQAQPITVAGKILQPVVRLQQWQAWGDAGGGTFVRLAPHSVDVQTGDGTYTVPIVNPTQATLRGFFYLGAVISGVCLLLMLLTVGVTRR